MRVVVCNRKSLCNEGELLVVSERVYAMKESCCRKSVCNEGALLQKEYRR